jgi:DinB family protein
MSDTRSSTATQPETWMRGPIEGIDPMLMPVAHALMQAREELERLATEIPADHVWLRPGGAASIGFHVRHLGAALDRLFTYARGERLSDAQKAVFRGEGEPGDPPAIFPDLVHDATAQIDRALEQLRRTNRDQLLEFRGVGRAQLPSNVLGLLFHAAEHSTRHAGQLITTARILAARAS